MRKLRIWRSLFTGRDNTSVDIGRVLFAGAVVATIGLETYSVIVIGRPFDAVQFGGAIGGLLVCGGAGIAVKAHTEPEETK